MQSINEKIEMFKTSDVQNLTTNDIKWMLWYLIDRSKKLDILQDGIENLKEHFTDMIEIYEKDNQKDIAQAYKSAKGALIYAKKRAEL